MLRNLFYILGIVSLLACSSTGKALDQAANTPAEVAQQPRIIVIGDIHGDYAQFVKVLRRTGIVNRRNKWIGGKTHLVQLGDIPDRGPDTRKAMDLLMKLEKSSVKAGGAVTVVIGNHEAMNMTNDLRFVHPGEYQAFKDKGSKARQSTYYQQTLDYLTEKAGEDEAPVFDDAYREKWQRRFPQGYVEHRIAWAPTGKYGKWVLSHPTIVQIGDTLFMHGGLSSKYSNMRLSEINTRVRTDLISAARLPEDSIVEDPLGPLWYRGWAELMPTEQNIAALDKVLQAYGAKRMVIAHTPTLPIVLPRFAGKVLMVDVGLSAHYGNAFAALEINNGKAIAIIGQQNLELPTSDADIDDYLDTAASLSISPERVQHYKKTRASKLEQAIHLERKLLEAKQVEQQSKAD